MANTKVVGSNTPKKRFFRFLMVILIIGLCLLMLSPFIWMIGASLKKEADVMKQGVGLFPTYWYPQNYLRVLGFAGKTNYHFLQGYWKSVAACGYSGTQQYRGDKDLCFGWNYGMEKEHGNVRDACRMTT